MRLILALHRRGSRIIQAGAPLERLRKLPCVPQIVRAKHAFGNDEMEAMQELEQQVNQALDALEKEYVRE